jgi:hypothetical protein
MIATLAERYAHAAQSLGFTSLAIQDDDADKAVAGAFTAFGVLWGTEPRENWERASQICQDLRKGYDKTELRDRTRQLRIHLEAENRRLRDEEAAPPAEIPQVLIMVESDPDYPDDLMGDPFTICPYADCDAEESIREVDRAERWNPVSWEGGAEDGGLVAHISGNSSFHRDRFVCADCRQPVTFPAELDEELSWG